MSKNRHLEEGLYCLCCKRVYTVYVARGFILFTYVFILQEGLYCLCVYIARGFILFMCLYCKRVYTVFVFTLLEGLYCLCCKRVYAVYVFILQEGLYCICVYVARGFILFMCLHC